MHGIGAILSVKAIVAIAIAGMLGIGVLAPLTEARTTHLDLGAGPFAPDASGDVVFRVNDGVLSGHIHARSLPALGSHAFYVLWFVRTDTGDKAFLGPIVNHDSILFLTAGNGEMRFRAPAFTDGPNKGSSISVGAVGDNLFVLIAEDHIDTFMPFPVSPPPSSFALSTTF